MEYLIIIVILICLLMILKILFGCSKKKLEQIAKDDKLDNIAKKYPNNIEMCKEYLRILNNDKVIIEEDKNATNSLYIAISNKIIIGNLNDSFTRIQTIAHECLHSIQDKKILMFNFIYSNIYILYFIIISILAVLKILPYKMMFLVILSIGGFIYYFVRSYLENDAMIKARFLAKEYLECKKISTKEEIQCIIDNLDKLNNVGIKSINYLLVASVITEIIAFCIICVIR